MISYDKLSKKEQRKVDNQKRKFWKVKPITRKIDSKKNYKRERLDFSSYL